MNNKSLIISLISLPVVTGAFLSTAFLSTATANECDAEIDLQGTVSKNEATVTNHSANADCNYDATLAVYDSPKEPETYGWIEAQTLIGSKSVNVKAGETVSLKVEGTGPSCYVQADLIRGTEVLTPPVYRTAMDVDVYKVKDSCETAPTSAPTPGSTTSNESSASTQPVKLASTGDVITVYAFLLTGFATVIAGLFIRKSNK